jgi:hypothetical protein
MNSTALLILIVAVVVIAVIVIAAAMASRRRMRSLPDESKARYAQQWRAIEARFIDDPGAAVHEADQLAMSILRERGARMDERKVPDDLRHAREEMRRDEGRTEGRSDTEAMRRAMLHYQSIVDDALGARTRKEAEKGHREVA